MSLFVGNVSHYLHPRDFEDAFDRYGRCKIDMKKSYAFVEYDDDRDAEDAIRGLNGRDFSGLRIKVEWSKKSGRAPPDAGRRDDRDRGGDRGGRRELTCYNCNEKGHFARDCREPDRRRGGGGGRGRSPPRYRRSPSPYGRRGRSRSRSRSPRRRSPPRRSYSPRGRSRSRSPRRSPSPRRFRSPPRRSRSASPRRGDSRSPRRSASPVREKTPEKREDTPPPAKEEPAAAPAAAEEAPRKNTAESAADSGAGNKEYKKMKVAELKEECKRLGLDTSGLKQNLIDRLEAHAEGK